jgi:hypothetical protein
MVVVVVGAGEEGHVPLSSLRLGIHDRSRDPGALPNKRGGKGPCKNSARSLYVTGVLSKFLIAQEHGGRTTRKKLPVRSTSGGDADEVWVSQKGAEKVLLRKGPSTECDGAAHKFCPTTSGSLRVPDFRQSLFRV